MPRYINNRAEKAAKAARSLGASDQTASFIGGAERQGNLYRVHYGHIDEKNPGPFDPEAKFSGEFRTLGEATKAYKGLGWLRDRDQKGRRYILIEKSSDKGKTWPTKLFYDTQR